MPSSIKNFSAGLTLGLAVFVLFFARGAIAAWVDPSDAPPGGNIEPPINTSAADQYKKGSLGINCGSNCPTGPIDPLVVYNAVSGDAVMTVTSTGVLTTNTVNTTTLNTTNFTTDNFSVTGDASVGGDVTVGQTLSVTGAATFGNKLSVGTLGTPVNVPSEDAVSVFTLSDGDKAGIYVRQTGPNTTYAAYLNGRTQINTRDLLRRGDENSLSVYANSPSNASGIYVEDTGSGKAATFAGNVLIKRQGSSAGELAVGEDANRVAGVGKTAITAYAGNLATAISGISTNGNALSGRADTGFGVEGISGSATGVRGLSESGGTGVLGNSVGGIGVSGTTNGTAPSSAGVSATSSTTAPALVANNSGTGPSAIFKNGDVQVQQDLGINVDKQLRFNEDSSKDAYFEYDSSEQCLRLLVGGERVAAWPDPDDGVCLPNCSAAGGHCIDRIANCLPNFEQNSNFYCPVDLKCCAPDNIAHREY